MGWKREPKGECVVRAAGRAAHDGSSATPRWRRWVARGARLLATGTLAASLSTAAATATANAASSAGPPRITVMPVRVTAPTLPLWASGSVFRWIVRVIWEPQHGTNVYAMTRGYREVRGRFEIWTPKIAPGWYRMVIVNKYGSSNGPWVRVYPTSRFRAGWNCPVTWTGYSIPGIHGVWIQCRRVSTTAARWFGPPPKKAVPAKRPAAPTATHAPTKPATKP